MSVLLSPLAVWAAFHAFAAPQEAPGKFDPQNISGYLARLNRSSHPEAVRIRESLANGAGQLEEQRRHARAEGIPLSPSELKRPSVLPSNNAAPLYVKLHALLRQKPLNPRSGPRKSFLEDPMGPRISYRPSEITAARRHLAARRDVSALIHRASELAGCRFERDWSKGMYILFPEFATMRGAARLLTSESYLLAESGRYDKAVETMARGFRIANHAASEPLLIAHLVAIAIDAITLRGLEHILEMAPARTDVARLVRETVVKNRPGLNPRLALEGELALFTSWAMNEIRQSPGTLVTAMALDLADPVKPPRLSADETDFVRKLADSAEAKLIARMRRLIAISRLPDPRRVPEAEKLGRETDVLEKSGDPADQLVSVLLPVFAQAFQSYSRIRAQEGITIATAAVMEYRARTGKFPATLAVAIKPPVDPFTGQPMGYRREPRGFVIYSAGRSGRFQGGTPGMKREGREAYYRYPPPPKRAPEPR